MQLENVAALAPDGRTVALVQKPDYVSLYQQLGIDVAVSPRLLEVYAEDGLTLEQSVAQLMRRLTWASFLSKSA